MGRKLTKEKIIKKIILAERMINEFSPWKGRNYIGHWKRCAYFAYLNQARDLRANLEKMEKME